MVEVVTFEGGAAESARAQGARNPLGIQAILRDRLSQPHDFDDPYWSKHIAFTRREFPVLTTQLEEYGAAAGIDDFNLVYFLHVYATGMPSCSALGLVLSEDGPAMLTTNDVMAPEKVRRLLDQTIIKVFPDLKPHGYMGPGIEAAIVSYRNLNDAGLMLGGGSGRPKVTWPDNPETVNLYFLFHLLSQNCADCNDVRHFIQQYRLSGVKGTTITAVDAAGNILYVDLEGEHYGFMEPEDGVAVATNHWQVPEMQARARALDPDYWRSPNYYNSQSRVDYVERNRAAFARMRTLDELVDYSFDVHQPGRLLQVERYSIDNWVSAYAIFMTARDRTFRFHAAPLAKNQYLDLKLPVPALAGAV